MKKSLYSFFLLFLFFGITSCEKEQNINTETNSLKTISIDEAKDFLDSKIGSTISRNANDSYILSYSDYFSHEEIISNSEYMTVIPALTINEDLYSRILILSINGKTQSVVYSMLFDATSTENSFTGEILITDLDGNFLNGYVAENGQITMQYIQTGNGQNRYANSYYRTDGEECPDCPFNECSHCGELSTVVVTGQSNNNSIADIDEFLWSSGVQAGWNIPTSGNEIDPYYVGGGTDDTISVEEQSLTTLCGSYDFNQIGNAQSANISNLYIQIYVTSPFSTPEVINVDLNEICISIPYTSSIAASNIFNSAWENAKQDLYNEMSSNSSLLNDVNATYAFRDFLIDRLQLEKPGSAYSSLPCPGVPTTEAQYCI